MTPVLCICVFQVEFPPDLCSRVTFVNFTVTRSSLQSQCLNEVLKAERPDVDEKRSDLLKLQGEPWLSTTSLILTIYLSLSLSRLCMVDINKVFTALLQNHTVMICTYSQLLLIPLMH